MHVASETYASDVICYCNYEDSHWFKFNMFKLKLLKVVSHFKYTHLNNSKISLLFICIYFFFRKIWLHFMLERRWCCKILGKGPTNNLKVLWARQRIFLQNLMKKESLVKTNSKGLHFFRSGQFCSTMHYKICY